MNKTLNSPQGPGTDWGGIFCRLTLFAYLRLGCGADIARAEDLAHAAISRFLTDYSGLDIPLGKPNLLHDLETVLEATLSDPRPRNASGDPPRIQEAVSGRPVPAQTALNPPARSNSVSLLAGQIVGDRLLEGIVLLSLDGIADASAQAAHLVVPIARLYEARKRLLRILVKIRAAS